MSRNVCCKQTPIRPQSEPTKCINLFKFRNKIVNVQLFPTVPKNCDTSLLYFSHKILSPNYQLVYLLFISANALKLTYKKNHFNFFSSSCWEINRHRSRKPSFGLLSSPSKDNGDNTPELISIIHSRNLPELNGKSYSLWCFFLRLYLERNNKKLEGLN